MPMSSIETIFRKFDFLSFSSSSMPTQNYIQYLTIICAVIILLALWYYLSEFTQPREYDLEPTWEKK
jgi:hypothetical protein